MPSFPLRRAIRLIRTLNPRKADIVELNPTRDINDITATVAAKLAREIAALAARSAG